MSHLGFDSFPRPGCCWSLSIPPSDTSASAASPPRLPDFPVTAVLLPSDRCFSLSSSSDIRYLLIQVRLCLRHSTYSPLLHPLSRCSPFVPRLDITSEVAVSLHVRLPLREVGIPAVAVSDATYYRRSARVAPTGLQSEHDLLHQNSVCLKGARPPRFSHCLRC